MQTFRLKVTSQANYILFLIIFFAIVIPAILLKNKYWPIPLDILQTILIISSFILLYYFLQRIAIGKIEISFNHDIISIHWLKPFPFTKLRDTKFSWDEIEEFTEGKEPYYHKFRITLISGYEYRFYHSKMERKDDYQDFIIKFESQYNKLKSS